MKVRPHVTVKCDLNQDALIPYSSVAPARGRGLKQLSVRLTNRS